MKRTIGEIAEIVMGQSPKSEFYNNNGDGMPFLQGNRTFGDLYPTFDTYTTNPTKTAKAGDIIMSVRAPVGDLNITPVDMCLGRGVCALRMKNGNQSYLFYLLKHNVKTLINRESGTVFGSVNYKDIASLLVDYEENEEEQRRIGQFLWDIDQKIETNKAINNNLMQQAKLLFKSWFVDYLPFGCIVPTDWQTMTLGEVSNMSAGGDKPKVVTQYRDETCKYPIYSNGLSDDGLYGYTNEPKIFDESVTVSARGTIGFVCLRHIPYVPIVRLVTLVPKANVMDAKYLYLYLNQLHIRGTGTTQQQLTVPDFRKTTILVPTKSVLDHFSDIVTPLFTEKWANDEENSSLADLRNTLLPKLLSGELDVSDIDL